VLLPACAGFRCPIQTPEQETQEDTVQTRVTVETPEQGTQEDTVQTRVTVETPEQGTQEDTVQTRVTVETIAWRGAHGTHHQLPVGGGLACEHIRAARISETKEDKDGTTDNFC
jgi:hypothetical protein